MESKPPNCYFTVKDYFNTPEDVRMELIDGKFYDMAPPNLRHQTLVGELFASIHDHIKRKGGPCRVYPAPFGVQLSEDENTVVEPDISVICNPDKLTEKGCLGAPDWIIEIVSPSDPARDYIMKLKKYLSAGVREYWIVDPASSKVTVYDLTNERVIPVLYTFNDTVKAGIYDDLSIDFSEITASLK